VLLATIRDVRSRLLPAVLGIGAHCVADIAALYAAADGRRDLPWYSGSLWCLGWPLVAVADRPGTGRAARRTPTGAEFDRREALASHAATGDRRRASSAPRCSRPGPCLWSRGRRCCSGWSVGVIGVREVVGALVRTQLTAGLRQQAHRDPLTGLANRRAVTARIARIDDAGAWIVITWTSTASSRSTTCSGTRRATRCWSSPRKAVPAGRARRTGWRPGWAATSSPS
jgi:hypothetical protein